uniref:Uncharacterized protein n=1 Tax=Physcomitrium patens TaxID=3218 RepID=A0A2K1KGE6_PHYPA|nr:hypothetical protein PHYPA_009229 [Physcomitrium patens]
MTHSVDYVRDSISNHSTIGITLLEVHRYQSRASMYKCLCTRTHMLGTRSMQPSSESGSISWCFLIAVQELTPHLDLLGPEC